MGKGIDMARALGPEHAALLDDLKDQLLIVMVQKAGGKMSIPVADVDATGGLVLAFRVDMKTRTFHFEVQKKL